MRPLCLQLLLLILSYNLYGYVSNTIIPTPGLTGVFNRPLAIAITPNGQYAYVTNLGNSVNVIDIATNTLKSTPGLTSGFNDPQSIAITPDGQYAYVADAGSGSVIVIETANNMIISTPHLTHAFYYTASIAITPDGQYAYVTSGSDVNVIEIATNTVVPTPDLVGFLGNTGMFDGTYLDNITDTSDYLAGVFTSPDAIAITPDGHYAYVADLFDQVQVIDIASNTLISAPRLSGVFSPPFVQSLAINPNDQYVYVSSSQHGISGTVSVIDIATNSLIAAPGITSAFNFVGGLAFTPDGGTAYVVDVILHSPAGTDGVAVIDTASNTRISAPGIATGFTNPQRIAITPNGMYAYVTDVRNNSVTVIFIGLNPALNFMANKRKNVFLLQTDNINLLTWSAPTTGNAPAAYAIYRDPALTQLIATIPAACPLQYCDRNRNPCANDTYYIISLDAAGNTSAPAMATATHC